MCCTTSWSNCPLSFNMIWWNSWSYEETKVKSEKSLRKHNNCQNLVYCNQETTSAVPSYGLTVHQVSTWSDENCRRSYTDEWTDRRTDIGGYIIIPRHYLVTGYKNCSRWHQSKNMTWFSWELSEQTIQMKYQAFFSLKTKNKFRQFARNITPCFLWKIINDLECHLLLLWLGA